jgi:RNA polymerase sigma-70 factor (ECF subfamily)
MDDRLAIERMRRGDISGLETLVNHYQLRAIRTAYLVTRDVALAQDVVQAGFVKAYEHIDQYDTQRPFGPWFQTLVLRDAIKAARERDRHLSLDGVDEDDAHAADDLLEDHRPGPEALWEETETSEQIKVALDRLNPEQRAVIVARYFLGMSEADAAKALASPLSTIKWRLYAARQRLRLFLRPATQD